MNDIFLSLLAYMGVVLPRRSEYAEKGFITGDIQCLFSVTSSTTEVDLTQFEVILAGMPSGGVLKSRGNGNASYGGTIQGLSVVLDHDIDPAVAKDFLNKFGVFMQAPGISTVVPVQSCVRIQPHVAAIMPTTAGLSAPYTPLATCGAPGSPAYLYDEPQVWSGTDQSLLKLVRGSTALSSGTVTGRVILTGGWAPNPAGAGVSESCGDSGQASVARRWGLKGTADELYLRGRALTRQWRGW